MQIAALEEIAQVNAAAGQIRQEQAALIQKWAPAVTYAAYMDNYLKEISGALGTSGQYGRQREICHQDRSGGTAV